MIHAREVLSGAENHIRMVHSAPVRHDALGRHLQKILDDVLFFSSLFNSGLPELRIDLFTYQDMLLSIFYRLIQFQPLGEPRVGSDVQAAYHIGLTMFMMTVFLQFQPNRTVEYSLAVRCLRDVLCTPVVESEKELALWVMVVGAIWIGDSAGGEWLGPKLKNTTRCLGLETWDEACCVLTRFPWVSAIHNRAGRIVWERLCETGSHT